MPYDRPDYSHYGRGEYGPAYEEPRTPYGTVYTRPSHGYEMGYDGGGLRSRGSYGVGPVRPRPMTLEETEFRWGGGYVGGRGYGGTNFDYEHGYRTGGRGESRQPERGRGQSGQPGHGRGQSWQPEHGRGQAGSWQRERERGGAMIGGPTRYGYGPYHERLKRRRRSDDEIQEDVREALFYDTWVDADQIRIDVDEGVVTLDGTLPDFDEVRYATDDAWDVDGVRGVRTELNVDQSPVSDRLGRQREFSAGQLAEANESGTAARDRGRPSGEPVGGRRPGGRTTPRSGAPGRAPGEHATPGIGGTGRRRAEHTVSRAGGMDREMGEHLAPRLGREATGPRTGERLKPRPGAGSRTRAASAGTGQESGGPADEQREPGTERSAGQWSRTSTGGEPTAPEPEPERSGEPEERGG